MTLGPRHGSRASARNSSITPAPLPQAQPLIAARCLSNTVDKLRAPGARPRAGTRSAPPPCPVGPKRGRSTASSACSTASHRYLPWLFARTASRLDADLRRMITTPTSPPKAATTPSTIDPGYGSDQTASSITSTAINNENFSLRIGFQPRVRPLHAHMLLPQSIGHVIATGRTRTAAWHTVKDLRPAVTRACALPRRPSWLQRIRRCHHIGHGQMSVEHRG